MTPAFVGFDPDEVEKLVAQLRGAAEDIANMARQADQALERARTIVPGPNILEVDVGRLRGCGITIGEMSADVQNRLTKFREDQRFEATQQWAERSLGGVSEGLERTLEGARRWQPGHWVRGEWIPGRLVVEERLAAVITDDFVIGAYSRQVGLIPGRFGPHSWVEPSWVDDVAKQRVGKFVGRGMNGLDVGLAAWGEWGRRSDVSGAERLAHAGLAGVTEGGGSAIGGAAGYWAGAALAGMVVGTGGAAGVVILAGGVVGAVAGSELGRVGGRFLKERVKSIGRGAATGVKAVGTGAQKVLGWFS